MRREDEASFAREGVCLTPHFYEEILERHFANWTMGQVKIESINPALLLKYYEKAELNPFSCSGKATMALLLELLAAGVISHRGNS